MRWSATIVMVTSMWDCIWTTQGSPHLGTVLQHFNPALCVAVHIDGSQHTVGSFFPSFFGEVLLQWQPGEDHQRPVAFMSRKRIGAQFRFDARNVKSLSHSGRQTETVRQCVCETWRPLVVDDPHQAAIVRALPQRKKERKPRQHVGCHQCVPPHVRPDWSVTRRCRDEGCL